MSICMSFWLLLLLAVPVCAQDEPIFVEQPCECGERIEKEGGDHSVVSSVYSSPEQPNECQSQEQVCGTKDAFPRLIHPSQSVVVEQEHEEDSDFDELLNDLENKGALNRPVELVRKRSTMFSRMKDFFQQMGFTCFMYGHAIKDRMVKAWKKMW